MSLLTKWWDDLHETQQQIDARRRENMLFEFRAATYKKIYKRYYHYANMGYVRIRTYPSTVIDNWSAAWKLRRHWEEQTERRKAAGKPVY